jgi:hypothetical protein
MVKVQISSVALKWLIVSMMAVVMLTIAVLLHVYQAERRELPPWPEPGQPVHDPF